MSNVTSPAPAMRSTLDRIRQALLFECLALALVIPVGTYVFGLQTEQMGVIGVGSAITATVWNYLYNLGFDHAMQRVFGTTTKTLTTRLIHTLFFEAGLQVVLLPAIAFYLKISIMAAFSMSFTIAVFYLIYAFFFNLAYDFIFPVQPTLSPPNV